MEKSLKGTKTEKNLLKAFTGESQAKNRMVEITATYPAGKTRTTKDNLKAAADGEHEEWNDLYPAFAKIAEELSCLPASG